MLFPKEPHSIRALAFTAIEIGFWENAPFFQQNCSWEPCPLHCRRPHMYSSHLRISCLTKKFFFQNRIWNCELQHPTPQLRSTPSSFFLYNMVSQQMYLLNSIFLFITHLLETKIYEHSVNAYSICKEGINELFWPTCWPWGLILYLELDHSNSSTPGLRYNSLSFFLIF